MLSGSEVAKHNSGESCWLVIHGKIYDVSSFLDKHPGGRAALLTQAGADATPEFDKIHSIDIVEDLPDGSCLGDIDPATLQDLSPPRALVPEPSKPEDESKVQHLSLCITASDFEAEAMKVLDRRARVYITSSANSGLSLRGNLDDWSRVGFRPRVMRDVASVDTGAAALGHPARLPFFACPMGTMGMAHPDGELALVRGLARGGVHGVASTASSKPAGRIMEAFAAEHAALGGASPSRLFFQLYVPADRARALALVRKARAAGYAGLWVTVDTPVIGKRTADRRKQAEEALAAGAADQKPGTAAAQASAENAFAPAVGARPVPGSISPSVSWEDLEWIRGAWGGPIVLKGIQCAEDAKLAAENDCQGILLSNHGGRQQHTAPSALMTLLEIRAYCPEVLDKLEVYVDGGCRDGADVLKALCLGATAVGLGRPFFYALAAYGTAGVERCIDIISEELATGMRLLGVTSLDQLRPEMVNTSRLLNDMWRPEIPSIQSRL